MPRCFCGEELEQGQTDMCGPCKEAVEDALQDFETPEGVIARLPAPIGIAGVVMPHDKVVPSEEDAG